MRRRLIWPEKAFFPLEDASSVWLLEKYRRKLLRKNIEEARRVRAICSEMWRARRKIDNEIRDGSGPSHSVSTSGNWADASLWRLRVHDGKRARIQMAQLPSYQPTSPLSDIACNFWFEQSQIQRFSSGHFIAFPVIYFIFDHWSSHNSPCIKRARKGNKR